MLQFAQQAKSREVASGNQQTVYSFLDTFKNMIQEGGYSNQTTFNMDETGIFWKKVPKQTFIGHEKNISRFNHFLRLIDNDN